MLLRCSFQHLHGRRTGTIWTPRLLLISGFEKLRLRRNQFRWIFNADVNERCIRGCSWFQRIHALSSVWSPRATVRRGNLEFRVSPRVATQQQLNRERPEECQANVICVSAGALTRGYSVPLIPSLYTKAQPAEEKNHVETWESSSSKINVSEKCYLFIYFFDEQSKQN